MLDVSSFSFSLPTHYMRTDIQGSELIHYHTTVCRIQVKMVHTTPCTQFEALKKKVKMVRRGPWSMPFPGPLCQNGALDFVKRHMRSSLAFYLFLSPESVFRGWPSTSPLSSQPSPDRSPHKNFPIRSTRTALWWSGLRWETDRNPSSSSFLSPSNATLCSPCELITHEVSFELCCYNQSFFYCIMLAFFWYKIRRRLFSNIQHVSVYEGFGPGLPWGWAKGVSFFAGFPASYDHHAWQFPSHWNTFSDHSIILYIVDYKSVYDKM